MFVRSGDFNISTGSLRDFGLRGDWWSASARAYTSNTVASSGLLNINAVDTDPFNGSGRFHGFPLRCLAD